ncbi:TetR-like C-terminal domain-containing protein [Metabacillus halosaccharovorans]|uniref:TetR/AcrR family transcriptional regulator n=1 Tax=Metabacillus halosaccharovorans TaxID=930124 RepID=UPI000994CD6D|nr:TetR-like C-terminal domain-containing protein [Metabacillus halosaccharovorans]MCM3442231.1 TetR/AcrR family transcriptional regulator [Metabacillus halosaccharovorans]
MASSKLDRRKKYTQMVLKDSLMRLLKEKQISSITVKEICEHADINRSTFYSHYSDQFDLLDKIEDEIIEDLTGYLNQCHFENDEDDLQMIEKLLEYFASKHEVCQTLLNENSDTTFQKKVMVFAQDFFMNHWKAEKQLSEELSMYVSTFIISGSIYATKTWLNNGMDKSPKEMAELINHVIKYGLYGK